MQDSIFTKIIKGEVPAEKVYEDEANIAFLTIQPIQPGHTLVVPKQQIDELWDLPDDAYNSLMMASKKVAKRLKEVTGKKRVGVKVEGFEVAHAHIHLIPMDSVAEYNAPPQDAKSEELAGMAKKLAF
ncbi:MAG TPA: HIT family protein [Candidatus Saccharimonadales bacterium]|nr:HIT family protein [Candidatus Saccharimonadales bacterium]